MLDAVARGIKPKQTNIKSFCFNDLLIIPQDQLFLWSHPDEEGQKHNGYSRGRGQGSSVGQKTDPQHRSRLGNTPTQQEFTHSFTELMKKQRRQMNKYVNAEPDVRLQKPSRVNRESLGDLANEEMRESLRSSSRTSCQGTRNKLLRNQSAWALSRR